MNISLDKDGTQILIDFIKLYLPWILAGSVFICAVFFPIRFEKAIAMEVNIKNISGL